MSTKALRTGICKVLIISSMVFMIYGILKVNMTLPQVVRQSSGFYVTSNDQLSNVNIKIRDFNIILSGEPFKNFFKGAKAIGSTIKDLILP
jgi:hypothetical protein